LTSQAPARYNVTVTRRRRRKVQRQLGTPASVAMQAPAPAPPLDQLLTADEVAGFLKLSKKTVVRLVLSGDLPALRIGTRDRKVIRFKREAVLAFADPASVDHGSGGGSSSGGDKD